MFYTVAARWPQHIFRIESTANIYCITSVKILIKHNVLGLDHSALFSTRSPEVLFLCAKLYSLALSVVRHKHSRLNTLFTLSLREMKPMYITTIKSFPFLQTFTCIEDSSINLARQSFVPRSFSPPSKIKLFLQLPIDPN